MLIDLLVPAELAILGMVVGSWTAQALYVAAKLRNTRPAWTWSGGPRRISAELLGDRRFKTTYRVLRAR
jgi:hypothetical protein